MVEVTGTILSKGYDKEVKYSYNHNGNNYESFYYIITIETDYGKRMVRIRQDDNIKADLIGLEKLLDDGGRIGFHTRHPEQPIHTKHPQEIIVKKNKIIENQP